MDFLPAAEDACGPLLPNFWFGLVLSAAAATAAAVLSLAASPRAATAVEAAAEYKSRKACNRLLVHLSAALSILFSFGMVVLGGLALVQLAGGFWLCDKVSWFVSAALLFLFPALSAAGAALSRATDPRLLAGRKDHHSAPPPVVTADYILKTCFAAGLLAIGALGSLAACTVLVVASSACGDGRDFIAAMLLPLGAGLLSVSASAALCARLVHGAWARVQASAQGADNELVGITRGGSSVAPEMTAMEIKLEALSAQQQKLLAALEAADLAKQEIAPAPAPADGGRRQPKAGDAAPSEGGSAEAPAPTADEVDESAVRV